MVQHAMRIITKRGEPHAHGISYGETSDITRPIRGANVGRRGVERMVVSPRRTSWQTSAI